MIATARYRVLYQSITSVSTLGSFTLFFSHEKSHPVVGSEYTRTGSVPEANDADCGPRMTENRAL